MSGWPDRGPVSGPKLSVRGPTANPHPIPASSAGRTTAVLISRSLITPITLAPANPTPSRVPSRLSQEESSPDLRPLLLGPRSLVRAGRLDHLEVRPLALAQLLEPFDPGVGSDRRAPAPAVVGDEHAVLLQPL